LDPKTNAPIEIELPLLGRMKANYPALIFPFIAALFGYLGYMSQEMQPTTWSVTGSVGYADGNPLSLADWQNLHIKVMPDRYDATVKRVSLGHFAIEPDLLPRTSFEKEIQSITFILDNLSCQFIPKQEFGNWNDPSTRDKSLIKDVAQNSRALKGVKLNKYVSGDPPC
jgi:hypothetical protein